MLEFRLLLQGHGVGLSNDRDDVDNFAEVFHKLQIERPQAGAQRRGVSEPPCPPHSATTTTPGPPLGQGDRAGSLAEAAGLLLSDTHSPSAAQPPLGPHVPATSISLQILPLHKPCFPCSSGRLSLLLGLLPGAAAVPSRMSLCHGYLCTSRSARGPALLVGPPPSPHSVLQGPSWGPALHCPRAALPRGSGAQSALSLKSRDS